MTDKFFVVIIVLALIFAGLFVYLLSTDLRLRKLERQMKNDPKADPNESQQH